MNTTCPGPSTPASKLTSRRRFLERAGGGVKGGTVIGATDDVGLRAAVDKTHVHDVHATMLHLMGFDHERLTFRHGGRDERLTDVAGKVIERALA